MMRLWSGAIVPVSLAVGVGLVWACDTIAARIRARRAMAQGRRTYPCSHGAAPAPRWPRH